GHFGDGLAKSPGYPRWRFRSGSLLLGGLAASVENDIDRGLFDMTRVAVLELQGCMASSAAITHDVMATANRISAG
ncbi:hypothetical protein, partial [Stenotrophomonas maltophilia]|uniref:hypothetical protein n=1 Tax=Stenotrophomonas maltophilia TaxID=40324 RepID=UPI001954BD5A